MELLALAYVIAFEGSLTVAAGLLFATFLAFARMNKDVRRARMFIMADRVTRFLGAFTFGFLVIAVASILSIAGLPTAAPVFAVAIFLFLGAIVFGSLELFLIVRPRRSRVASSRIATGRIAGGAPEAPQAEDPPEGGLHAAR